MPGTVPPSDVQHIRNGIPSAGAEVSLVARDEGTDTSASERWRRWLLAILVLGAAGTATELILLEHYEDAWQYAPLVLLTAVLLSLTWYASSSSGRAVRVVRWLSLLMALSAAVGIFFHYRANVEWELETTPELHGFELFREVVTGALPLLAPGAMLQLGLLGLLWSFRHPRTEVARPVPAVHNHIQET